MSIPTRHVEGRHPVLQQRREGDKATLGTISLEVTERGLRPSRNYLPVTLPRTLLSPQAGARREAPAKGLLHGSWDHPDALPRSRRVSDSISLGVGGWAMHGKLGVFGASS